MDARDLIAQPMLARKRQGREDKESSVSSKKEKGLSSSLAKSTSTFTLSRTLDDLGDDELIQIFCRLPLSKFAFGLKLVSKRFYSLISNPYFVSQFITHHIDKKYPNPTTVFINSFKNSQLLRIAGDDDWIFESHRGYALEFLPEERAFVTVVASCNDLLYCRVLRRGNLPTKFYVCNPLTMQWFRLPPLRDRKDGSRDAYGLVCDPNYQAQQHECRFRVVHIISKTHNWFCYPVETYCSKTGRWNEPFLLGKQYFPRSNVVTHDAKLHWFNGSGVVAYDPFSNNVQSISIDSFDDSNSKCSSSLCVGVCQGMVRFMELLNYEDAEYKDNLSIWELEDYASGRLSLKHRIFINRGYSFSRNFASESGRKANPLAFHPNNKDVVYVGYCDFIISCKIRRGKLIVIGKTSNGSRSHLIQKVLTTVIPWWPTPVPQNAHDL